MMTLTSRMYKEEEKVSIIERFQVALSCTAIPPSPPSSINTNIETLVVGVKFKSKLSSVFDVFFSMKGTTNNDFKVFLFDNYSTYQIRWYGDQQCVRYNPHFHITLFFIACLWRFRPSWHLRDLTSLSCWWDQQPFHLGVGTPGGGGLWLWIEINSPWGGM